MTSDDDRLERARARGKRYAMAVFVTFAAAFIVSSTWQIVVEVFSLQGGPSPSAATLASPPCASALRDLESAVDRALTRASTARDDDEARRAFDDALTTTWSTSSLDARCQSAASPADADAHAAALRLRSAAEAGARRLSSNVGRARQDIEAFLPR